MQSQIRNANFNVEAAREYVLPRANIDDSVHHVRKSIYFLTKVKSKNQAQQDMIERTMEQERLKEELKMHAAIVPNPKASWEPFSGEQASLKKMPTQA